MISIEPFIVHVKPEKQMLLLPECPNKVFGCQHGLRTPNEGINQRYLKNWSMWQTKYASAYLNIWDWDLILGCGVKAISSPGVRSPWSK